MADTLVIKKVDWLMVLRKNLVPKKAHIFDSRYYDLGSLGETFVEGSPGG